jgi:transposase
VSFKNRVHSILKLNLITYDSSHLKKSVKRIIDEKLIKDVYVRQINILINQIDSLEDDTKKIESEIKKICYKCHQEEIEILISIMGISFFTACAIISDVADVSRFKNAKRFCSYLRAGMRVDSSNKITHVGKLNKKARKLSFNMILQGLLHIIRYNKNYSDFQIRKLKGKSNGKVRCALVRKTMVAIYYMLKNKETWRHCSEEKYKEKLALLNREVKYFNLEKKRA